MTLSPSYLGALASVTIALCSSSCRVARPVEFTQPVLHEWFDDGGPGKVTVSISLSDQIAHFERGGREIGWCYVATGREGYSTSSGHYQISEMIVDKYSTHYGWIEDAMGNVVNPDATPSTRVPSGMRYVPAPMPYWMRLTSFGIGMHGGVIPEPGKPASHGCIRMPKDFAPIVFAAVTLGTPVTITTAPSARGPALDGRQESQSPTPWQGDSRIISTRTQTRSDR